MDNNILIVGGYGAVGRIIATKLANKFPRRVTVAGRSYEKAHRFAVESGGNIQPIQIDMATAHENPHLLDNLAVVVMCLDVPDMRFVKQCLQRGIHYIDITAEDSILQQIEALNGVAKIGESTAVLSVGLSPGLTNLLTRHAQMRFDTLHHVDIYGFLGLGEEHGAAAARWTLKNLNARYTIREYGTLRQVSSFGESKMVHFPDGLGHRRVYRFNLADQHVLTRTLKLPSVSTWVTFDPAASAKLMAFLRRSGLSNLLRYQWIEDVAVNMSLAVQHGSEKFVVQVEALGEREGKTLSAKHAVTGSGQGRVTGLVAAQVVEDLLFNDYPTGVFHSEQLFEPLPFINKLVANNEMVEMLIEDK